MGQTPASYIHWDLKARMELLNKMKLVGGIVYTAFAVFCASRPSGGKLESRAFKFLSTGRHYFAVKILGKVF